MNDEMNVNEVIGELVEKYLFDEINNDVCKLLSELFERCRFDEVSVDMFKLLSDLFGGKIDVDDFNMEREKMWDEYVNYG